MSIAYGGDNIIFPDASVQNTASKYGMVNRIINGDMRIDQRNAGASITPTVTPTFNLDRWHAILTQSSKFSVQQNAGAVTPPAGFTHYLGVTSLSAYSVSASDYFLIRQSIEGFNVADLGWGTANASAVTLSFLVRSSITGTFGGAVQNAPGTPRFYAFSYTINAANTWELKTITIPGDTSGVWLNGNNVGIELTFALGVGTTFSVAAGSWGSTPALSATGATSVVGTNGATFYITGVSLVKSSVALPWEFRSYGTELALCQRYYEEVSVAANGAAFTNMGVAGRYMVYKRALPTIVRVGNWNSAAEAGTIVSVNEINQFFAYNPTANATHVGGVFTASAEL